MLKYRLIFGPLMLLLFSSVMVFDGWLDGSITTSPQDDKSIQATLLCILLILLVITAQKEFAKMAKAINLKIFTVPAAFASALFTGAWYWLQFINIPAGAYIAFLSAATYIMLLLLQYAHSRTEGVISNCGANYFSIIYLGLFSGFILAVRIDFGLWAFMMFIFTVKFADIGAYATGRLFGKTRFAPVISPGKTWEGLAGAMVLGLAVAVLFSIICDIIPLWQAVIFGPAFAFIGQISDLAESMIKRDAQIKDSAQKVPGFGGIMDIIDSPLIAAPFAYIFFLICIH